MTTHELKLSLSETYGLNPWPKQLSVDADTFADVCSTILIAKSSVMGFIELIEIGIGPSGGIMFKGVELLLDKSS